VRSTRKVALTSAGEKLLRSLDQGFGQLENGWMLLNQLREKPAGTVRINGSRQAIEQVLLPRLQSLRDAYPDIALELIENNTFVDIVKERYDAGVRYGSMVNEDMVSVRIGPDVPMRVVGSPNFLRQHGIPAHPRELDKYPCIGYRMSDGSPWGWEMHDGDRLYRHNPAGGWVFSDAGTVIKAATLGVGLAYEAADLMQDELASGRLIPVLENYSHTFPGFISLSAPERVQCAASDYRHSEDYPGADSRAIRTG
jgi:DNA-binding transcriptional LysR family regulator